MREVLENQPGVHIRQAEVVDLILKEQDSSTEEEQDSSTEMGALGPSHLGTGEEMPRDPSRPTRPHRRVLGLKLRDGRRLMAGATIITTGTFLNGLIHCGEERYPAGRSGEPASVLLGEALRASACAPAA